MHQARAERLYWCSATGVRNTERIGVSIIFGITSKETFADAVLPIRTISVLDWSRLPAANRNFPDNTGEDTPVYDGGVWVPYNSAPWDAHSPLDGTGMRTTCAGIIKRCAARG